MGSSIAGFAILQGHLGGADYLATFYTHRSDVSLAVAFHLINDISVAGIGIFMFVLLKQYNEKVATIVLATRMLETTLLVVGKISIMLLLTISKDYINSEMEDNFYPALGTLARKWNAWSFEMAMLGLGIGGFSLNYLFYSRKLVPIYISLLGLLGYTLLFVKSAVTIGGYPAPFYLFMPVAIFEIGFPFWLIIKGLKPSASEN